MRNIKITIKLHRILLILILITGLILLSTELIKTRIRQNVEDEAIEAVESAIDNGGSQELTFKLPVTDYLMVNGENGEEDKTIEDLLREMDSISAEHEEIKLLGILEVPCIELKEPIWDSCSSTALRFGVGRFPQTCQIGKEGTCSLFGHRMESHTIFWNLQSLENYIGEEGRYGLCKRCRSRSVYEIGFIRNRNALSHYVRLWSGSKQQRHIQATEYGIHRYLCT